VQDTLDSFSFWLTPLVLSAGTDCMDTPDKWKEYCKFLYKQTSGESMGEWEATVFCFFG